MQRWISTAWLIGFGLAVSNGHAAPASNEKATESKIEIQDVSGKKNAVDGDLDKEITNAKLRADSGSKSKYSMSTSLNYRGGSISRPFGVERPNLLGLPETQVDTSVDATMKVRYRTTAHDSLSLGVSMGLKTPFQGDMNSDENQLNIGDPLIGYNRTFAAFGLQNSWNLLASFGTSDESRRVDQISSVATDYTFMKAFQNGFHVGVTSSIYYNFYDSAPGANKYTARFDAPHKHDRRTEWAFTIFPTVEYTLNDTFSIRTLFSYFRFNNLYGDDEQGRLLRLKEYQSLGVGIAASRDVYLYPNVQFLPLDMRWGFTNFGLSASMNMF